MHLYFLILVANFASVQLDAEVDYYDLKTLSSYYSSNELVVNVSGLINNPYYQKFDFSDINAEERYHFFKFSFRNPSSNSHTLYVSGYFSDSLHVYEFDPSEGEILDQNVNAGYLVLPEDRSIKYEQSSILPINIPPESENTYVIVVDNFTEDGRNYMKSSFRMGMLAYTENGYHDTYFKLTLVNYFMLGLLLTVLLFNSILWFRLRDPTLGALIIYNIGYFLWVFIYSGMLVSFGIFDDLEAERTIRHAVPNFLIVTGHAVMVYFFLNLGKNNYKMGRLLIAVTILRDSVYVFNEFGDYEWFVLLEPVTVSLVYAVGIWAAFSVSKNEPLFYYPNIASIMMIITYGTYIYGYFDRSVNYLDVHILVELMMLAEVIVFAFATAHKVWIIKRQSIELKHEHNVVLDELNEKNRKLLTLTTMQINHNQELARIKQEIKQEPTISNNNRVIRSINNMINFDSNWDSFKLQFENVHGSFFIQLDHKYPGLTSNDHRLCAFIYLKLKNKEIADILGISHRSVEKAKERLKKKMKVDALQEAIAALV